MGEDEDEGMLGPPRVAMFGGSGTAMRMFRTNNLQGVK
jgi:hypothetical protein